jgi:hypothetical protein
MTLNSFQDWVQDLSEDKRVCKLLGYTCASDFDLGPELFTKEFQMRLLDALVLPEVAVDQGRCDELNIGLYDGGRDIRVWKVFRPGQS